MQKTASPFSAAFREKYDILENIGTGAFGSVFLARQLSLGREVAIKHLAPKHIPNQNLLKRFLREAKVLSALTHPNIVEIYDYGIDGELPYLVQEFLSGRAIDEFLVDEGPISEKRAIGIGKQVAQALRCAHDKGVIHRDLKPANIFISKEGNVKVLDFGLAMTSPEVDERLTKTGLVIGTPGYMAPELFYGKRATPCTDLYALGLMLFEMVSDQRPGEDENGKVVAQKRLSEAAPRLNAVLKKPVSREFENLVASMLELEPAARPKSANELLDRFAKLESVENPTELNEPLQKKELPKNNWLSSAAFFIPLLLALLVGLLLVQWTEPKQLQIGNVKAEAGTDKVALSWQSKEKTASSVEYGKRKSELLRLTCGSKLTNEHFVTIMGLEPSTRYVWRPSVDGYLPCQLFEFRTKEPLAIKRCKATRKGATEVEVEIAATDKGKLVIEIENWGTNTIKGSGPNWQFKLNGLKAGSSYRALAKVHGKSKTVSRKFFFKTILARPFITLAELRADKKHSSSPIISPLFMENVRVTAPQKLFQNSVIMAIEKYGLHSFSVTRRKTNWHKREHCKISKLRIRGDKFITLGTDGKLRLFLCQNGQKLWTSQCERTNLFANMFFTKAGIFIWQKSGPTCFSVKNGTMKWQLPAKNLTQHWIVTDDIAYIIDEKQYLRAYEAQSGRRRNELDRELEANVASAIVANKNYIVFGLADSTAMIIRSGDEPLRVSTNGSQFCNVLSLAKEMVICAFVKPPKLSAYSLRDGSLLWDKAIASRVKMSMTRRGRNLYYGDDRDFLVARDAKTGEKLWERYGNIVARFRLHATPRGVLYCSSSLALNEVIDGLEP